LPHFHGRTYAAQSRGFSVLRRCRAKRRHFDVDGSKGLSLNGLSFKRACGFYGLLIFRSWREATFFLSSRHCFHLVERSKECPAGRAHSTWNRHFVTGDLAFATFGLAWHFDCGIQFVRLAHARIVDGASSLSANRGKTVFRSSEPAEVGDNAVLRASGRLKMSRVD